MAFHTFHAGELEAQRRAGVGDVAAAAAGFIRDRMPEQHRAFFASLPFLVIASGDEAGQPWVSIIEGSEGFATSPNPRQLRLAASLDRADPLAATLASGNEIGMLGIALASRRRNRLNGFLRPEGTGYVIDVHQSFGNCPQYIHAREWRRVDAREAPPAWRFDRLQPSHKAWIAAADTLFIGSGVRADGSGTAGGFDASHRGGEPGFVRVATDGSLQIPDYPGNNFFNTIGNLIRDPRVGLLFVSFETGSLLQIAGRARIDWNAAGSDDPQARRMIRVAIDRVVERQGALSLRWSRDGVETLGMTVIDRVVESDAITSFHLAPRDGGPLAPFQPGMHLPVALTVPGQAGPVRRSYSLSGSPTAEHYRISVKREDRGIASRFLYDQVAVGDTIMTGRPAGAFQAPPGDSPLVLVSAGVGVTPMLSMLHAAVESQSGRPIRFVHGARNRRSHAFAAEIDALVATGAPIARLVYYSAPEAADAPGVHFDKAGRIKAADLIALDTGANADYMLCGPEGFLADIHAGLEAGGVDPGRIHFETFGPGG
ncbi:MAG: ferredoxin [Aurantimonas sp.]|uniref:pyridoxamine 5'-phosphate oxidase family protein n=1 Tax=Aurantimonas coralicida TaxID=182270 RepID=UPI000C453310|nr:pyridoxamine 5'-phosphate oxidase family protein [Aurantimonas coralicida]MAY30316.1 ferredoxin [Aurantimonas sp.]MCD1644122.1 pyridoxamine 5'-phosphate oxidase family protein [Aurantimonas coralicida]